jgi:hypothetical protein
MPRSTLTVFEGSLRGPVVGTYHHNGLNGLYGPKRGEIICLTGVDWLIVEGVSLWEQGSIGTLIVERVDGVDSLLLSGPSLGASAGGPRPRLHSTPARSRTRERHRGRSIGS